MADNLGRVQKKLDLTKTQRDTMRDMYETVENENRAMYIVRAKSEVWLDCSPSPLDHERRA